MKVCGGHVVLHIHVVLHVLSSLHSIVADTCGKNDERVSHQRVKSPRKLSQQNIHKGLILFARTRAHSLTRVFARVISQ
jgi:hypothetical protein